MVSPFCYCFDVHARPVAVEYFHFASEEEDILAYIDVEKSRFGAHTIRLKLGLLKHGSGCRPQVLVLEAKPNFCREVFLARHQLIAFFMKEGILRQNVLLQKLCSLHDGMKKTPIEMLREVLLQQHIGCTLTPLRSAEKPALEAKKSANSSPNISSSWNSFNYSTVKKRLNLRSYRNNYSRTAFKRIDIRRVSASSFRKFFRFYSLRGGRLKSGSVMTRLNSNHWLKNAGIVRDRDAVKFADQLFKDVAGCKVVLNIFDFIRFLNALCRQKGLVLAELLQQLMSPVSSPQILFAWNNRKHIEGESCKS